MELRLPAAILARLAVGTSAACAEDTLTLGSNLRFWRPTSSVAASSLTARPLNPGGDYM